MATHRVVLTGSAETRARDFINLAEDFSPDALDAGSVEWSMSIKRDGPTIGFMEPIRRGA